jgi:hypothetical protein
MAFQARLLAALSDPALSLRDVADRLGLPLDQLSLVISRPDLASEIAAMDALAATRVRLVATSCLPAAANTARQILDDFNAPESNCPRETALRAVRILLRLANFASGPMQPRPAPTRAPRAEKPISTPAPSPAFARGESHPDSHLESQLESTVAPAAARLPAIRETPSTQAEVDADASFDVPAEGDLSDAEAIVLAGQLIKQGAFTEDQLAEVFRLAAQEAAQEATLDTDASDPDGPLANASIADFIALANRLEEAEPRKSVRHATHQPAVNQLACAPP